MVERDIAIRLIISLMNTIDAGPNERDKHRWVIRPSEVQEYIERVWTKN